MNSIVTCPIVQIIKLKKIKYFKKALNLIYLTNYSMVFIFLFNINKKFMLVIQYQMTKNC